MFDFHAFVSKPLGIGYFSPLTQLTELHVIVYVTCNINGIWPAFYNSPHRLF